MWVVSFGAASLLMWALVNAPVRSEANFAVPVFSSSLSQNRPEHTTANCGAPWMASSAEIAIFIPALVNSDGPSPSTSSLRPVPPLSVNEKVGKMPSFNSMPSSRRSVDSLPARSAIDCPSARSTLGVESGANSSSSNR